MIGDLTLRWVVTVLSVLAVAECLYSLLAHRMRWPGAVGHGLHLVMAAAMGAMAWPATMDWPTIAPMIVFLLAAGWFVVAAAVFAGDRAARIADGYHAVMMAAMAWMYAVMNGSLLPGSSANESADGSPMSGSMPSGSMPGMSHGDMSSMPGMMPGMSHGGGAEPGYLTPVHVVLGVFFAVAAVVWLYLYFARRQSDAAAQSEAVAQSEASALLTRSGELCQVLMATGMSIMFFAMA
ncbi:DUF5134 domain-containing protein [Gordonia sinesedis]